MVENIQYTSIPVIIDSGSGFTKIGLANESAPTFIFPTLIGYPRSDANVNEMNEYYIGEDAVQQRNLLNLVYPIKWSYKSQIAYSLELVDLHAMETIWDFIFHKALKINPKKTPVILTDPPFSPTSVKEKIAEIMFELFGVPSLHIAMQAELALSVTGKTTGCVVDLGATTTNLVLILEGKVLDNLSSRVHVGGININKYLQNLFRQRGILVDLEFANYLKEKFCFISQDPEKDLSYWHKSPSDVFLEKCSLPNNEIITIGNESFLAPESLLIPSIAGLREPPLYERIYNTISEVDYELRSEFFENILLCGGSSLLSGIKERLTKELQELVAESIKFNLITPPNRQYYSWIGGKMLYSKKNI
ncbi:MAG: hypothetical protein ACFFD2_27645, partial [Promethearchaeota archaeon]